MKDSSIRLDRRSVLALVPLFAAAALPASAASPISVNDAWTKPGSGSTAVYGTIVNAGATPDRLIGGMTPNAASVELHDAAHGTAAVPAIVVPANGSVTLSVSGPYVQLVGLKNDLADGSLLLLRLHFETAGYIVAIVHVRA